MRAFGYSFTPDALFHDGNDLYVVELKWAAKYEPMALAEVLHHAEFLSTDNQTKQVHPVIIASWNGWLRLALTHLHKHGLARDVVAYYEADSLQSKEDGERFIWIDAPLAPWNAARPDRRPPCLGKHDASHLTWYRVDDVDSWYGVSAPMPERPPFIQAPYAMVTPISTDLCLAWDGTPATRGSGRQRFEDSQYYLWRRGGPDGEAPRFLDPRWPGDPTA